MTAFVRLLCKVLACAAGLALFLASQAAAAELLNWNYPGANVNLLAGTSNTTVSGVTVYSSGAASGVFTTNSLQITPAASSNGSSTGVVSYAMNATIDDMSAFQTLTVRFSEPVYNVAFTVLDIDGGPAYNGLWNDIVDFSSDGGFPTGVVTNGAWVNYNAATGRASAISNQNAASGNANQANGNIRVTFTGPITFFTVRHYSGPVNDPGTGANETNPANQTIFVDDVTFIRSPRLAIQKTSNGGIGTFDFSINNGFTFTAPSTYTYGATTTSVTTAVAGTPVTGTSNILGVVNTATTITETSPTGWIITSSPVACTDSNTADSGNPANFNATVSGYVVTIAAANIRAGAVLICSIVNEKRPTLQVVKSSTGGTDSFSFTATNGFGSTSLDTALSNPRSSAVITLTNASTATSITETIPTGWKLASAACTGMGGGGTATLVGNVLTLNAAATAATANIVCTFTNTKTPIVRVQKITNGGTGGAFSFTQSNLDTTPANISTSATGTPTPASPLAHYVTSTASPVSLTESFPALAWVSAGVTCTDANAGTTGNPTPVATSTGTSVNIPAANLIFGADIACVYTNTAANPQLSLTKTPSVPSVSTVGASVTYTIAVNNPGNVTLTGITLSDALGTVVCPTSGNNTIASLAPSTSENCSFTYAATIADFDSNGGGDGDIDNTATGSTTYNGNAVSANASAAVLLTLDPEIFIQKSADTAGPVSAGDVITYTYIVRNDGNQTISGIALNDAHNGNGAAVVPGSEALYADAAPLGNSTDATIDGAWDSLAPGDEISFTATYTVVQADIDLLQ